MVFYVFSWIDVNLNKSIETCLESILILSIWLPLFYPFVGLDKFICELFHLKISVKFSIYIMEHIECEMFLAIKLTLKNTFYMWMLSVSWASRRSDSQIRATGWFSCEDWWEWQNNRGHAVSIRCKGSHDIRKVHKLWIHSKGFTSKAQHEKNGSQKKRH